MEAIAERGRTVMQWLLILGLLAGWAIFDRSPRVVEEARRMIDTSLRDPATLGLAADPLADLPREVAAPWRQYRHEFLRHIDFNDLSWVAAQRDSLRPLPIGVTIALGKHVLAKVDQQPTHGLREELVIRPLRAKLAQLETWHTRSGLSSSATLAEVEDELRSRLQIPGTEQAVAIEQCMLFVGLGILTLHILLTSIFITCRDLAFGADPDRSWIVLHRAPLGPMLTMLWIALPAAAWIVQDLVRATRSGIPPGLWSWSMIAALLGTTLVAINAARRTRGELLASRTVTISPTVIEPARRAA